MHWMKFGDWPIRRKLSAFVVFVVMVMTIGTAGSLYFKREATLTAKRDQTRNLVEVAHGIVAQSFNLEQSGQLTRAEAQARATELLRTLRYDQKEYFWINDMQPRMVMHPIKPELDGQDLSTNTDPHGKKLFVAFVDEVKRAGSGYVDYMWPKPGVSEPVDKVSYVKGFEPWGWIIGSGIYVDDVNAQVWADIKMSAVAGAFGAFLIIAFAWLLTRVITRPLSAAVSVADAIAGGKLDNTIETEAKDETGQLLKSLKIMQDNLLERIEADARVAAENLRVRNALDRVTSCVMIADVSGKIIYLNESVTRMLQVGEADIKKDLPNFNAATVLGSSVDQFHKNPGMQKGMLSGLKQAHKAAIKVGGRSYNLTAVPVHDEAGERLGTAVEWVDRTAEVAAEGEVNSLVQAANDGDFSKRVALEGKEGFLKGLAQGINALMNTSQISLADVARVLGALAKGDLTERIEGDYKGTWGRMKDDANATVDKLAAIVTQIKESTESINVASKEIASGNTDLSSRTEEQASSLEETASSMEELTSTVKQNADNAKQANHLAAGTLDVAIHGAGAVDQVVATMGKINESSRKIVDIISVIDGIAFQTNILALNAAVEAARAGEQGRGFAVVASEVRNLAQRSAAAAKEIKTLINDSVEKVGTGSTLVNEAGKTMQEIVVSVKRVTDIMAEITAASQEQSSGIEQVNQAITQMDEVTQQNAALVEEAAAAAESMEEQAQHLAQAVSAFKFKRKVHSAPAQENSGSESPVVERRNWATRPKNVARLPAKAHSQPPARQPATKKASGTTGEWSEF